MIVDGVPSIFDAKYINETAPLSDTMEELCLMVQLHASGDIMLMATAAPPIPHRK